MSSQLKESLSAAVDNEADEFEMRRVLDEVSREPELRASWNRYHAIGALIRGEHSQRSRRAAPLLARMWAAIERASDDTDLPLETSGSRAWGRRMAGGAVAAVVALGIVIGFGPFGSTNDSADSSLFAIQAPPVMSVPVVATREATAVSDLAADALAAAEGATQTAPLRPFPSESDLARSQGYMLHHAHQLGLNRPPGPTSFVRVAAFESR